MQALPINTRQPLGENNNRFFLGPCNVNLLDNKGKEGCPWPVTCSQLSLAVLHTPGVQKKKCHLLYCITFKNKEWKKGITFSFSDFGLFAEWMNNTGTTEQTKNILILDQYNIFKFIQMKAIV